MRALWTVAAIVSLSTNNLAAQSTAPKPKKGDPNEIVCEKVEVIGSRLAVKKVCGTRAEWAEKRKQDRDVVDQAQRAANGPCATVNSHTGAPAC